MNKTVARFVGVQAVTMLPLMMASTAAGTAGALAQEAVCDTASPSVICEFVSAEDLVHVPDTKWVLVSSYSTAGRPGEGLMLVDSTTRESQVVEWTTADAAGPEGCPGPLEQAELSPHGIAIGPGEGDALKAYAVNHGRRTIEMFDVTTGGEVPQFAWSGCVVLPASVNPNAVAPLPDGRLAVSSFLVNGDDAATEKFFAQENTGFIALWDPASGWSEMAGSEASGNNGVAVSPDGKYLFFAAWSGMEVVRLTIDAIPYERESIPVDFLADNMHVGRDGQLLLAGQFSDLDGGFSCIAGPDSPWVCPLDTKAVSIDPTTLEVTELFTLAGSPEFGAGTTVLDLDDEYWVGTFRGNAIARVAR
ncbi:hypothetical protein SAMN06295905_3342 [Devosia lucknowensis]|uniref:SMP-30/Gluconolaconase/LRE-like region-containing protein n=1 Tax=Devosia lucknowensis TaxID=1096929 RepID=A0A1Y6G7G7_9HYPH|nr:hypothetical protein [Devosia lucknowensis]SMQ86046.1 hypothetical protein SAMN06295905_3342 [Devosia lucknowensis]